MRLRVWRRREAADRTRRGDFPHLCLWRFLRFHEKDCIVLLATGSRWARVGELICLSPFPLLCFGFLFLVGCFLRVILLLAQHALLLSRSIDTHHLFSPVVYFFNQFLPRDSWKFHRPGSAPDTSPGMHLFAIVGQPGILARIGIAGVLVLNCLVLTCSFLTCLGVFCDQLSDSAPLSGSGFKWTEL